MSAKGIKEPVLLGGDVSNAGAPTIELDIPYSVAVTIRGLCPIFFHRWQCDAVDAQANAAKGSKAKRTDNVQAYVWRNQEGVICLPGEYLRGSLIDKDKGAARFRQDPRSPRKSAIDLYRASILSLSDLAPITLGNGRQAKDWEYLDRRRVRVQQNSITRTRPALLEGWTATVVLLVQTPTYISPSDLLAALGDAGKLVGVGDHRPTFGRFAVTGFDVLE